MCQFTSLLTEHFDLLFIIKEGWFDIFVIRYICHPLYLSSVISVIRAGGGGGRGCTCNKCSCHFFGYFTGSYKLFGAFFPLIFFWLSKILGRAEQFIFFYFVVMQMRNRRRDNCTDGNVKVRYKTL